MNGSSSSSSSSSLDDMLHGFPSVDAYVGDNQFHAGSRVCGYLMYVVFLIGLAGNVITLHIFTRRPLVSSINTLLAGLAAADALVLVFGAPLFGLLAVCYVNRCSEPFNSAVLYMTVYVYPVTSIFQTVSVWTMVLVTVERYLAVCHPFTARTACTWRRALLALAAVVSLSVLYNFSRFWDYRLGSDTIHIVTANGSRRTSLVTTVEDYLRSNDVYRHVYTHWFYFVFVFAVPFVVLVLLNSLIVTAIRRAQRFRAGLSRQQCKDHNTATMMLAVSAMFLVCNSLAFIINVIDIFHFSIVQEKLDGVQEPARAYQQQQQQQLHMMQQSGVGRSASNRTLLTPVTSAPDQDRSIDRLLPPLDRSDDPFANDDVFFFLIDLNNLLIMFHCSVNFFIYLIFSRHFRRYCALTLLSCCGFARRRPPDSTVAREHASSQSLRRNSRRQSRLSQRRAADNAAAVAAANDAAARHGDERVPFLSMDTMKRVTEAGCMIVNNHHNYRHHHQRQNGELPPRRRRPFSRHRLRSSSSTKRTTTATSPPLSPPMSPLDDNPNNNNNVVSL